MLLKGNCLETLKTLDTGSVDSIVTDPPYELGFMGKSWDASGIAYNADLWAECLRVLKPGGHLLAFSGSRTYHRMVVAIEDSGFEIRDQIMWLYGSGFPKSLDISKAIDKRGGANIGWFGAWFRKWREENGISQKEVAALFPSKTGNLTGCVANWELGLNLPTPDQFNLIRDTYNLPFADIAEAEREVVGTKTSGIANKDEGPRHTIGASKSIEVDITAPATPEAQQWQGWGTALKPAHEPIVVARKPLIGTVANNVLTYGTGGLNIDGTRVGSEERTNQPAGNGKSQQPSATTGASNGGLQGGFNYSPEAEPVIVQGRWPANIVITHSPDCEQVGTKDDTLQAGERTANFGTQETQSGGNGSGNWGSKSVSVPIWECAEGCPARELDGQSGVSKSGGKKKAHKANPDGLFGFGGAPNQEIKPSEGYASRFFTQTTYTEPDYPQFLYCAKAGKKERNAGLGAQNFHPTVKPLTLMRHLVKLVTPPNGTVLDPFLGSGTTAVAATLEGFQWIGCEITEDYWPIIEARVEWAAQQPRPEKTLF